MRHVNEAEASLLRDVRGLTPVLVEWTRELVAIPTVNPYSGDASAGSEAAGQDWIADRLAELGGAVRRVPVPNDVYERGGIIGPSGRSWSGRDNVVSEWSLGAGGGPRLVVNDHMDTVGTEGMEIPPYDPVVKDGRLYGRGSTDSKGNLVMGLIALRALLRQAEALRGRLAFESVVDEESNGAGAGTLACCLAGVGGDAAICLDGSTGGLVNGCNGIVTARLLVRGQAGHSSTGTAVSAIDKGIAVKRALDDFGAAHAREHPGCRLNVGIFRSGSLPAIVPGEAEIQFNMSYSVEDAEAAWRAEGRWDGRACRTRFERAMAAMAERDPWFAARPVGVEWIKDMYPFRCDPREALLQKAAAAAEEVRGEPATMAPMPAWFDAAHLARQLRAPVVGMGCGTPGCAHSAAEFVAIEDLVRGAQALALTLRRLLTR